MLTMIALMLTWPKGDLYCYSSECKEKYLYEEVVSTPFLSPSAHQNGENIVWISEREELSSPDKIYEYPALCNSAICMGLDNCDNENYICLLRNDSDLVINFAIPIDMSKTEWTVDGVSFSKSTKSFGDTKDLIMVSWWSDQDRKNPLAGHFIYSKCRGLLSFVRWIEGSIGVYVLKDGQDRGFGAQQCSSR